MTVARQTRRRPPVVALRLAVAVMAVAVACVALMPTTVTAGCGTRDNGEPIVNCKICPNSGGTENQINDLAGVPRLNFKGKLISGDIGAYTIYECDSAGSNCELKFTDWEINDVLQGDQKNSRNIANFLQGYLTHVGFAILMVLLTMVIAFGLLLGRYCCCCCGKRRCIGGCCGSRFPTQRPAANATRCQRWCSFGGMVPTKEALEGNKDAARWAYSKQSRLAALALFLSFIFCTFLFIGMGFFSGVRAMPGAVSSATADGPSAMLALVGGVEAPLGDLLAGLASDTFVGALIGFNKTFNDAVDLRDVLVQSDCVLDSVATLPSVAGLTAFIVDTNRRLSLLVTRVAEIIPDLERDLAEQEASFRAAMDAALVAPMVALTFSVEASRNATLDTHAHLVAFDRRIAEWTNAENGTASVNSDLSTLSTIPTSAQTSDLTTTGPASLTALADIRAPATPATDMAPQDREDLLAKLDLFRSRYASLPNFTVTARRIRAVDASMGEFLEARAIQSLLDSINTTTTSLADLDVKAARLENATAVFHANSGDMVDFSGPQAAIDRLNSTLYSAETVPDFGRLGVEIDLLIRPLTSRIIPCLTQLFSYVSSINASLVQLPESMSVAADVLNKVNATVDDAQAAVDEIAASMADFETKRGGLDLAAFQTKLDNIRLGIISNNSVGNSTYFDSINSALNATRALNFTLLIAQMQSFNTTLHANRLANATNASAPFETFQLSKEDLLASLERVQADTIVYDQGYCSHNTALLCRLDADCGGANTCDQVGMKRCKLQPTTPCNNDGTTTQDADVQCVGVAGDYCLVSPHRVQDLIARLQASADGAPALVLAGTTVSTQLGAIETAGNAIETDGVKLQLLDAAAQLGATNTSDFYASIDSAGDQFSAFNMTDLNAQVDSLNNSVTSIDYSNTYEQIDALNATLVDVQTEQLQPLRDSRQVLYAFQQMLHVKFGEYARTLSAASLRAIRASEGVAGLVGVVAGVVDDASAFLRANQNEFTFNTTLLEDTADAREKISILLGQGAAGREAADLGALYTITRLAAEDSYLTPSDADWSARDQYDKSTTGGAYAGGKKCVTEDCLSNTVEHYLGSSSGGGATIEELSGGSLPVPLTREQVQAIPLVLPLLVVIFALIGVATFKYTSWSSCCSSTALCVLFPVAALLFMLSALLFPMLLVTGDTCRGLENIAMQYVVAQGDQACTSLLGGSGSARACAFESVNDTQIIVDVPQAFLNIMGGRCGPGEDSIAVSWAGLQSSVESYPTRTADEFFDDQMNDAAEGGASDKLVIRPQLQEPLREAARSGGQLFRAFVGRLGSDSLSCSALHRAWKGVKAPICCAVGTTIYWSLGCIYLLAFSLLCCGLPSILMGRKRFPAKAWGPYACDTKGYPETMSALPGLGASAAAGQVLPLEGEDALVGAQIAPDEHEHDHEHEGAVRHQRQVVDREDSDEEGEEHEAHVRYGPADTAVPGETDEHQQPRRNSLVTGNVTPDAAGSRVSRDRGDDSGRSVASPSGVGVGVSGVASPSGAYAIEMSPARAVRPGAVFFMQGQQQQQLASPSAPLYQHGSVVSPSGVGVGMGSPSGVGGVVSSPHGVVSPSGVVASPSAPSTPSPVVFGSPSRYIGSPSRQQ